MVFYDRLQLCCEKSNTSVTALLKTIGLSTSFLSTPSVWRATDTTGRLLDDCEKKLADLEKQINRLIDLYQMGIDADNISQRLRVAQDAKIKLENEITLLKEKAPRNAVSGALGAIQELSGCLDDPADKEGHRRMVEARQRGGCYSKANFRLGNWPERAKHQSAQGTG